MAKWNINLSTTDENHIGLVKVRMDNNSEVFRATITENGKPYDFKANGINKVYFNTKFQRFGTVQEEATIIDATNGIIEYTLTDNDMQQATDTHHNHIQLAYFEFRKDDAYVASTQTFGYHIMSSIYKECTDGQSYIVRLEELFKLYQDFMNQQSQSWVEFVESNREILENIDPGGVILTELIDFRHSDMLDKTFDRIKDRGKFWDEEIKKRGGFSVEWFGAVGDYDIENNTGTDNSKAFQECYKHCKENNIPMFIPNGNFLSLEPLSKEAVTDITIISESENAKIFYGGKEPEDITDDWPFAVFGENVNINILNLTTNEHLQSKGLVIGYHEGVFSADKQYKTTIGKLIMQPTHINTVTGFSVYARNGGFYDVSINQISIQGYGTNIEISSYHDNKNEKTGWITGITIGRTWTKSFLNYGFKVTNDFNEANFPDVYAGQLTQCDFGVLEIHSQSRGSNNTGLLLGGGANTIQTLNIFNDSWNESGTGDFTAIELYDKHIEFYKNNNEAFLGHSSYIFGQNSVLSGFVEGSLKLNYLENLNSMSFLHANKSQATSNGNVYQFNSQTATNLIKNGDFNSHPGKMGITTTGCTSSWDGTKLVLKEITSNNRFHIEAPKQLARRFFPVGGYITNYIVLAPISDYEIQLSDVNLTCQTGISGALKYSTSSLSKLPSGDILVKRVYAVTELADSSSNACMVIDCAFGANLVGKTINIRKIGFINKLVEYSDAITIGSQADYFFENTVTIAKGERYAEVSISSIADFNSTDKLKLGINLHIYKLSRSTVYYDQFFDGSKVYIGLDKISDIDEKFSIQVSN